MQIIEEYLKKDLSRKDLKSWADIRRGYLERACKLVENDRQSPSYLHSLISEAGRREGKIIGNINDYTRDQHDLALEYEKKFSKEYLPNLLVFPLESYVTSSGMAALTTIIAMMHREHGVDNTILVGKRSYFQNLELLKNNFSKVVLFDENDEMQWKKLIREEQPLAVFVDTMCNERDLTLPPVEKIAECLANNLISKGYIVVDNSMLATGFPWKKILKFRSRKLIIVGWESLNKYYQFGLDRTTGGIVWGSNIKVRVGLSVARRQAGTIMSDIQVAMLPTPNHKTMEHYLERIENNAALFQGMIQELASKKRVEKVIRSKSEYGFGGAQLVIEFEEEPSYAQIQKIIKKMILKSKREGLQLVAGTSFGMPNTRIYLTAKATSYTQMFLRISVGTEEVEVVERLADVIASSL